MKKEEIEKLAREWIYHNTIWHLVDDRGTEMTTKDDVIKAYMAGFLKAMEILKQNDQK